MPLLGRLKRVLPPIFTPKLSKSNPIPALPTTPVIEERSDTSSITPPAVRAAAQWSWQFIVIVAAVAVALFGLVQVSIVVVPVLVATLVTALLLPVSSFIQRRLKFPRTLAVITTLVLGAGAAGGLVFVVIRELIQEIPALYRSALGGFREALNWLVEGPFDLNQSVLNDYLNGIIGQLEANAQMIISGALTITSSLTSILSGAFIMIFCLYFFLRDGKKIWAWVVHLFPRTARHRVHGAGARSWVSVGAYVRTQILVAFVDAVGIGAGAAILGIPLALPIGVLVFLGSFIPIVGAIITGTIAIAVALVDQGVVAAAIMLAIVLGVQQIEGNLLQPLLMGRALRLHPVAVLLSVAAGTYLAGIIGALIAVPILAVVNTAVKYLISGEDPPLGIDPDLVPTPVSPGEPPSMAVTPTVEIDDIQGSITPQETPTETPRDASRETSRDTSSAVFGNTPQSDLQESSRNESPENS